MAWRAVLFAFAALLSYLGPLQTPGAGYIDGVCKVSEGVAPAGLAADGPP